MAARSQCLSKRPTSIYRRTALGLGVAAGLCMPSAKAQEIVTDAPVAQPGGTANIGFYSADGSVTGGPAFHFTKEVVLQSVVFDPGPGGAQELRVVTMNGCALGQTIPAGQMCGIGTEIVSRYPGLRFGTLRVVTTAKSFVIPVSFVSYGSQVAVTPGTVVSPVAGQTITVNGNAMALDAVGNIYLADTAAGVVRKVDAVSGVTSIVAGTLNDHDQSGDGGLATAAAIGAPSDITISPAGDLYIVTSSASASTVIRKVAASTGFISTTASLKAEAHMIVDVVGNVFIAVPSMHQLLAITPTQEQKTLIGESCNTSTPYAPSAMALHDSYLYFASGSQVFKMSTDTSACHPATAVAATGTPGNNGDGGLATSAALGSSLSLALDAAGNLYIADATNNVVRMMSADSGTISSIAGTGTSLANTSVGDLALDVRGNLLLLGANGNVQKVDVSTTSLNFGEVAIGDASTNATQGIVFTNTGNVAQQVGTPILTDGFTLDAASTCGQGNASQSLAPGASCTAVVRFTPSTAGNSNGTLRMMGSTVTLSGTATGSALTPIAKLSTQSIDFGTVAQGNSSAAWIVMLSNPSALSLSISSITLSDTKNFLLSGNCGTAIAPRGSCTESISFAPQATGTFKATLKFIDNANPSTQAVLLTAESSGYSVSMDSDVLTLRAGQSGTANFTLTPVGGYTGKVSFACVGLPENVSCNFAPSTLTADGSDKVQTTQLTVTMRNAGVSATRTSGNTTALAAIFSLGALSLACFKRRRGANLKLLAMLVLISGAMSAMTGCAGSSFTSNPVTVSASNVQVMAVGTAANVASGANATSTQSASFTLTIMQ